MIIENPLINIEQSSYKADKIASIEIFKRKKLFIKYCIPGISPFINVCGFDKNPSK